MAAKKPVPKAKARAAALCQSHALCTEPGMIGCDLHVACGEPATHIVLCRSDSPTKHARMLSCEDHVAGFRGFQTLTLEGLHRMETAFGDLLPGPREALQKLLALLALDIEAPDPEAMEPYERAAALLRGLSAHDLRALLSFCLHPSNPLAYYGHPKIEYRYMAREMLKGYS